MFFLCIGCVSIHCIRLSNTSAFGVKGDRAVFVRPWDIPKMGLCTKSSVASKRFCLQTIMTPLWKHFCSTTPTSILGLIWSRYRRSANFCLYWPNSLGYTLVALYKVHRSCCSRTPTGLIWMSLSTGWQFFKWKWSTSQKLTHLLIIFTIFYIVE